MTDQPDYPFTTVGVRGNPDSDGNVVFDWFSEVRQGGRPLTSEAIEDAFRALQALVEKTGQPISIRPTHAFWPEPAIQTAETSPQS